MAKKKPETVAEKIADVVDKVLHPEPSESGHDEHKNKAEKVDTDSIQKHKKFDKFKK